VVGTAVVDVADGRLFTRIAALRPPGPTAVMVRTSRSASLTLLRKYVVSVPATLTGELMPSISKEVTGPPPPLAQVRVRSTHFVPPPHTVGGVSAVSWKFTGAFGGGGAAVVVVVGTAVVVVVGTAVVDVVGTVVDVVVGADPYGNGVDTAVGDDPPGPNAVTENVKVPAVGSPAPSNVVDVCDPPRSTDLPFQATRYDETTPPPLAPKDTAKSPPV
jgi:hypothetical protein